MALQQIFELANNLEINRRKLVGVQYTRSEIPRTDRTLTKNPWRFKLSVSGQPWDRVRGLIEDLNTLDANTPEIIQLGSNPNFSWLYRYLGDYSPMNDGITAPPVGLIVGSFVENKLVINNADTLFSTAQRVLAKGDMIQIQGFPFPFTSTTDVVFNPASSSVTVTTHRPNIITSSVVGGQLNVGENCQIQMFCPQMPTYKLMPGAFRIGNGTQVINNAIVEWSDDFEFYEWLIAA